MILFLTRFVLDKNKSQCASRVLHACRPLPTYTRQPNSPVDGDRSKQSDFFAGVIGKGNGTYGERRAGWQGLGVERSFFTPISLWRVLCEWRAVVTAHLLLPSV